MLKPVQKYTFGRNISFSGKELYHPLKTQGYYLSLPVKKTDTMITFILNNKLIKTDVSAGMSLLNYIRNEAGLKGTKSGCKEGDCGACTVLQGQLSNGKLFYKAIVSCLTPLGNVHGKHIVTIEGLNTSNLSPVQQAIVNNAGTQCGFCTPGFIMSLTGYSLSKQAGLKSGAIASIAGNICRCTGYKSIEKAALKVGDLLKDKDSDRDIEWLSDHHFIPDYFNTISARLSTITKRKLNSSQADMVVGGGTDLMVQKPNMVKVSALNLTLNNPNLNIITKRGNRITIGASVTVNDLLNNHHLTDAFPKLNTWFKLISSEQIRNTATLAGNFVNASPIGDMSILFLAMDTTLTLSSSSNKKRDIPLKNFFLNYKQLDLAKGEIIESIQFDLPGKQSHVNFEKVSKRLHLDIASVNSALKLKVADNVIVHASLAAGGIAPVPKYFNKTSAFLWGKPLSIDTLIEAEDIMQKEVSPISDVRGSAIYKRLLLRQLFFTHFMEMFPDSFTPQLVLPVLKA